MAETFYIRLPFYLADGSTQRNVDISFDNTVISTADISATSVNAMNYVNFSITKDPGVYTLKITPKLGTDPNEGFSTVALDDVWVSNDNVKFYSLLVNYTPDKNPIVSSPSNYTVGFNPAKGAVLYDDVEFTVEVNLPNLENWNKLYTTETVEDIKASYDEIIANGTPEKQANASKLLEAYDLFKSRGYN